MSNPYPAGAGYHQAHLDDACNRLSSVQKGYVQQSVIYYGPPGVGKTALQTDIKAAAGNMNILYSHIEVSEDGEFARRLMSALKKFAHSVGLKRAAKDLAEQCTVLIQSFVRYSIEGESTEAKMCPDAGLSSGIFDDDLTEIFVTLGKAALKSDNTVCLFLSEMQYLSETEISGLVAAMHRCNQLRLPIILFGTGLPQILQIVGGARPYAERLFSFQKISP